MVLIPSTTKMGMVAHICNLQCLRYGGSRIMNPGPSLIYTVSSRLGQPELQENVAQIKFKSALQQIPVYKQ